MVDRRVQKDKEFDNIWKYLEGHREGSRRKVSETKFLMRNSTDKNDKNCKILGNDSDSVSDFAEADRKIS